MESARVIPGRWWPPALLITLAAFLIRIQGLGDWWLNPDEGIHFHVATQATWALVNQNLLHQAQPPLYYYLLRIFSLAGHDFAWLRSLSVLADSGTVLLAFLLGRRLGGMPLAVGFSLAMACSPAAVTLSRVMRQYSMMLLFLTAALLLLVRWLDGRRAGDLAWYSVFVTLALFTHYGAMVALAGMLLFLAYRGAAGALRGRDLGRLAAAHLLPAAGLLFLYLWHLRPHLIGKPIQTGSMQGYLSPFLIRSPADAWRGLSGVAGLCFGTPWRWPALALIVLGWLGARRRREVAGLSLAALAAAIAFSAAGQYPFGASRHSVFLLPFLALPLAAGAVTLLGLGRRTAIPALAVLLLAGWGLDRWNPGDTRGASRLPPLPERIIPYGDAMTVLAALDTLRETPGVIILDASTLDALSPVLGDAADRMKYHRDPALRYFPWGRRTMVVADAWMLRAGTGGEGDPGHLAELVRRMRRPGSPVPAAGPDVRVLSAGWGYPLVNQIGLIPKLRGARPAADEIVQGRGISVFRLRPRYYLRALRRANMGT